MVGIPTESVNHSSAWPECRRAEARTGPGVLPDLAEEHPAESVIDGGGGRRAQPADARTQTLDGDRTHVLDENVAAMVEIRFRRLDRNVQQSRSLGACQRTNDDEPHPIAVEAVNRHDDGRSSSSLLVTAHRIGIHPPHFAPPRSRLVAGHATHRTSPPPARSRPQMPPIP